MIDHKNNIICFLALVALFFSGFSTPVFSQVDKRGVNQQWKTDKTNHSVPLNEFTALLGRDKISPIDKPKYWGKKEGDGVFFPHEPVISIEINGEAKAYPLSILMFHEIVNDTIGGTPISATYCPLCNAAIVFDRRLTFKDKKYLLDFGTSGMLRNSDLVMWDRQTETWWQQFTGEGLVGELNGAELVMLPSMLISYESFFKSYPNGKVLSTDNGHNAPYGRNPYVEYDNPSNKQPRLFKGKVDSRFRATERVISIRVKGVDRIYPLSIVQKKKVINDLSHGVPVVVFWQLGTVSVMDKREIKKSKDIGAVTVFSRELEGKQLNFKAVDNGFRDGETNSLWNITGHCIEGKLKGKQLKAIHHGNHFAFAWFAFQPDCEIYKE
ncbi:MAG: DUF3179 domain-containing protein [bacterium]|nr:DUF3179 domain-containing protein [bacterium]